MQIAGKFGDEVALDINQMTDKEREDLGARLAAATDANEIEKQAVVHYEKGPDGPSQA